MRSPRFRLSLGTSRRAHAALALGLAATLALAGCGGSSDKGSSGPNAQDTSHGKTLKAYWPLTGLPLTGEPPSHPPVIVKMDNTVASQPQVGLKYADLVTEELVEGGLTRLAVFFDTYIPHLVGPVRSMRASDIGFVKPVNGVVVTSGAAAPTIARLRGAGVHFESNDGGAVGFFRQSGREAPYDLMMHLRELVNTFKQEPATQPYLDWGKASDFTGKLPAKHITAHFGSGHTTEWVYAGGKYLNTNSNAPVGQRFQPDTVIAIRVKIRDAGYTDPAGNFVPESVTIGSGKAVIFHGGMAMPATWSKAGVTKTWQFKNAAGKTVKIPAGHVWLEVMPVDPAGGRLTFGR